MILFGSQFICLQQLIFYVDPHAQNPQIGPQTFDYPMRNPLIISVLQKHQISISKSIRCVILSWSARSGMSFPQFESASAPLGSPAPTRHAIVQAFPHNVENVWKSFSFFEDRLRLEENARTWLTLGNKLRGDSL